MFTRQKTALGISRSTPLSLQLPLPALAPFTSTKGGFDYPESVGTLVSMKSLGELSVADLRQVIALKEQIQSLEGQIEAIAGEAGVGAACTTEAPALAKPPKRRLSAAHRRKLTKALAKARRVRWAKAETTGASPAPRKRRMSAAGRAAISAAAKARWAKVRANHPR